MAKRMAFVVVARRRETEFKIYGPYSSFKRAEGDSNAWHGVNQWECFVTPLVEPLGHMAELTVKPAA